MNGWAGIAILGVLLLMLFLWRGRKVVVAPPPVVREIVVDGTNVLFWRDETAQMATLQTVLSRLRREGFDPVVFLDASTRHHLGDTSLRERKFARVLEVPKRHIIIADKGTEADGALLAYAGENKLAVVSNDKFRDRPNAARNIRLVKGRFEGKRLVLKNLKG